MGIATGEQHDMVADIVRALMQAPRTVGDLTDVCGVSQDCARAYLKAFGDGGLVVPRVRSRTTGRRGPNPIEYHWCPVPFEMPESLKEAA